MTPLVLYKGIDQRINFHLSDEDDNDITDATGTAGLFTRKGKTVLDPVSFEADDSSPVDPGGYFIDIDGATFSPAEGSEYYLEIISVRPVGGNGRWRRPVIIQWDQGADAS